MAESLSSVARKVKRNGLISARDCGIIPLAMRYAIISDIHANAAALRTVLVDAQDMRVDKIICLGDVLVKIILLRILLRDLILRLTRKVILVLW